MVGRIVANEDGSMVIPPEIAASVGIAPKTEYIVYQHDGRILMISRDRLLPLLDSMTDAMIEKMEAAGGFSDDATFLFGLTVEEYFALSEEEEAALWEKRYKEESERVNDEPEIDVPSYFTSSGQKRC
ncbi:MAG: hypothetical protein ACE5PV_23095 [Candidatus Poribacteria bacterium]